MRSTGIGVAWGLIRGKRHPGKGRGGWWGLGVLAALVAGLFISAQLGRESLVWFFGLSLMVAVPIMFFLALGSAIGRRLSRQRSDGAGESNQ